MVGIDPGLRGGLVAVDDLGRVVDDLKMPILKKGLIDVGAIQDFLISVNPSFVYLEGQHIRRRQGGQFKIGENFGRLTAVVDLVEIDRAIVRPKVWQGYIYKRLEDDGGVRDTKEWAIRYSIQEGYDVPWTSTRKDASRHDGLADAFGIARYGLAAIDKTEPIV